MSTLFLPERAIPPKIAEKGGKMFEKVLGSAGWFLILERRVLLYVIEIEKCFGGDVMLFQMVHPAPMLVTSPMRGQDIWI